MRIPRSFIILFLLFTLVACDKGTGDDPDKNMGSEGGKCYPAGNCDEGLVCEDGVCVKDGSGDQPDDSDDGKGDVGDECDNHSDCKNHLKCEDGFCVEDIADSDDDKDKIDDTDYPDDFEDSDQTVDPDDIAQPDDDLDEDALPDDEEKPRCGNGIVDPGEECDNGSFNTDEPGEIGSTCRTDCTYARCGDGIIDPGEICDDGEEDGYCSDDCKAVTGRCGDGILQTNEACDNADFGAGIGVYCNETCSEVVGSCGDGKRQSNEVCDKAEPEVGEGEGVGPHYCSDDCKTVIGRCGDDLEQPNEDCDDGEDNGKYGYCNEDCSGPGPRCGDGVIDSDYEVCDNADFGDGIGQYCNEDCSAIIGFCGDGTVQSHEACDKASFDFGEGEGIGKYCSDDCSEILGECGDDEVLEGVEDCDWGENNGGTFCEYGIEESCTVCTNSCKLVPGTPRFCGDGKVHPSMGEVCDKADFDQGTGEYCSDDCKEKLGECGDGIVLEDVEACDKATYGDGIGPHYCSDDCSEVIGSCGDGKKQDNEECDHGENNSEYCGYGEESCTVCSEQCKLVAGKVRYCGDSRVDTDFEEICDQGENNGTYTLSSPGTCNDDCKGRGAGGFCGDGIEQSEHGEQCDDGENNGETECPYNTNCNVCTTSCELVPGETSSCGDGFLDVANGEVCDSGENNGQYGFCKSDCSGWMPECGDENIDSEHGEVCDDGENNGQYGYCNTTCTGFMPKCGDGVLNSGFGEVCDHGTNNGDYRTASPGHCNSDCQGFGEGGYCGDSVVTEPFEQCDHSGVIELKCDYGDTECTVCDSSCQFAAGQVFVCGDGVIHREDCTGYTNCVVISGANEECDDGVNNGQHGYCKADCSGMGPVCGDGIIQREDCTGYSNCVVTLGSNEECDDAENNGEYGYCNETCSGPGPRCGDGEINGEEVCDDGANNGKYDFMAPGFCDSDCMGRGEGGFCGDDIENGIELCDDGEDNGEYGKCREDCGGPAPYCGDGNTDEDFGEICDDGEDNGQYGKCNTECTGFAEHCGDGIEQSEHEQCDDGENNGNTECQYGESSCTVCSEDCEESPGVVVGYCGDGAVQDGYGEECDHSGTIDLDCPYGWDGCLVCNEECKLVSGNVVGYCGDGVTQREDCTGYSNCVEVAGVNEECDDAEYNGYSGYCSTDCSYVLACGDDNLDLGEFCDPPGSTVDCDFIPHFSSGTTTCPAGCGFPDASTCNEDPAYASPFFAASQTDCYDNTGSISPCPSSGTPFYGQEPQFNYLAQSFVADVDVIEETVSGLIWQKETPANYAGCSGSSGSLCSYSEAYDYCENLDLGGFSDWRLPYGYEIITLMNFAKTPPLMHSDFADTAIDSYWTTDIALFSMADGTVVNSDPSEYKFVKCVRGEATECIGCQRNSIIKEGQLYVDVLDDVTFEIVFWYFDDADTAVNWENALGYCSAVSENGMSNFRLPTVMELHSLVERSSMPASLIDTLHSDIFWTSTTSHAQNDNAFVVDFSNGDVVLNAKTGSAFVICIK
jgi:hypothetical protein